MNFEHVISLLFCRIPAEIAAFYYGVPLDRESLTFSAAGATLSVTVKCAAAGYFLMLLVAIAYFRLRASAPHAADPHADPLPRTSAPLAADPHTNPLPRSGGALAADPHADISPRSGISAENRRSRFEGSRRPSALAADLLPIPLIAYVLTLFVNTLRIIAIAPVDAAFPHENAPIIHLIVGVAFFLPAFVAVCLYENRRSRKCR